MKSTTSKSGRAAIAGGYTVVGPRGKAGYEQVLKRSAKNGQFVLTRRSGEAISAVEGLEVSPRMASMFREMDSSGLSREERRAHIKETFRKK